MAGNVREKSPSSVLLVAIACFYGAGVASAAVGDVNPGAGLSEGKWHGIACFCGYVTHNEFIVRRDGDKLTAQGFYSIAMSRAEVRAAVGGKLDKDQAQPFAMVVYQNYDIVPEGDLVTLKGGKGRVVFTGSENSGRWMPDCFAGKIVEPGMFIGALRPTGNYQATNRPKDGIFYFCREDAVSQPLKISMEKGRTNELTCLDGAEYHYSCYVPSSYNPGVPSPVLINKNPGGNAKPLSAKMAEELGWIMVGLKESSNDNPESTENCAAVIFDLGRRLNVHPRRIYFSGLSGRARQSAWESINFPDECGGIICIGAGFSQYAAGIRKGEYKIPPLNVPAFFLVGQTDMNNKEVAGYLGPAEEQRGRVVKVQVHPGGHDWGRAEDHEEAIRWLDGLWKEKDKAVLQK